MAATDRKTNDHDHKYILICCIHISRCNFRVYCEWQSSCSSRNISSNHCCCSEFTKSSGKCKHSTRNDPWQCIWDHNSKKNAPLTHSKCSCRKDQIFNRSVPRHLLQNGTSTEMTSQLPQGSLRPMKMQS
mgnify:CR=1 FL=1